LNSAGTDTANHNHIYVHAPTCQVQQSESLDPGHAPTLHKAGAHSREWWQQHGEQHDEQDGNACQQHKHATAAIKAHHTSTGASDTNTAAAAQIRLPYI